MHNIVILNNSELYHALRQLQRCFADDCFIMENIEDTTKNANNFYIILINAEDPDIIRSLNSIVTKPAENIYLLVLQSKSKNNSNEMTIEKIKGLACTNQIRFINKPYALSDLLEILLNIFQQFKNNADYILLGGMLFNFSAREVKCSDDKVIALTEIENNIVKFLYENKDRFIKRDELLKQVWGYQPDIDTHTLETHIYRLRKKLGSDLIQNNGEDGYIIPVT